jgi:8-oxo-dGTP diphosphatase
MHEAALIVLYDDDGRILLQKRSHDAWFMPDRWAYFGGKMEGHESPREALDRESQEELNYTPRTPELILDEVFDYNGFVFRLHIFLDYAGDMKPSLELHEGADWGWFNAEEISGLNTIAHDIVGFERAFQRIAEKA